MGWQITHIAQTESTNRWLKDSGGADRSVVWADFQTAGRGCGTNSWESERGKNLTFSLLLHPEPLTASEQFRISMAVSLAICEALDQLVGDISIKWPNDIYWRNGKLCGILIENTLKGPLIKDSIVGVGLNVNQERFVSDAPNPVSLWQITSQPTDCGELLGDILRRIDVLMPLACHGSRQGGAGGDLRRSYLSRLYRRRGFHPYVDAHGAFMAQIVDVGDDGLLTLVDEGANRRRYAFKEVQFVI